MPEHTIGVRPKDIVHQKKTAEGSLTVSYNKRDIVANTIGHVLAIPTTHTLLWTWGSAFKNPTRELAEQLFDRYKDVPWKGDVLVRVGHTEIFNDIKRMLARNEDVRGRPWNIKDKVGRTLEYAGKAGIVVLQVPTLIKNKIFRRDYYNPFSNTVNIYHPRLAAGMHELGHAEFFNQMENKKRAAYYLAMVNPIVQIPFFRSFMEYQASSIAMKRFKNDTERRQGLKILEAAWATYLGIDALTAAAIVAPALALPLLKSAISISIALPSIGYKAVVTAGLAPYGAAFAGHAMNRLYPKKDQRFGYIFEGKHPVKAPAAALGPHQVLEATARPVQMKKPEEATPADQDRHSHRQFSSGGDRSGKRPLHSNSNRITF
ncbi:hypothetical protein KJZ67_02595 [Patescibacteria group bacterium]|nr:hypothetical protein [Patescibacteria group bacterium]